jgi:hypothetical protein
MLDKIKKIVDRIYEFDLEKAELMDGSEIVVKNNVSEFVMTFRKRDLDRGIIVTPSGYENGLVYKSTNGGEFYNNPSWVPDIVNFAFNIYGLKKNAFYKITVLARDTGSNKVITSDRSLKVTNEQKELLLDYNLAGSRDNAEYYGIFRSVSNETNLFFNIGKIYISDIIIEEVEIITEEVIEEVETTVSEYHEGKMQLISYGVFTTQPNTNEIYKGRYLQMTKYAGKGLSLFFDKTNNQYVLERDNVDDVIGESFTNIKYIVNFNFNKVVNKGHFSQYDICEVSLEISPNTLKQGFIRFEFVDKDDKPIVYANKDGRITVTVHKLY